MLLILDDVHKEHLAFLNTVSIEVVHEFCRISMEFIRKGVNQKAYQIAAQKLATTVETVIQCVQGLTYLLTESVRLMLNKSDFHESISKLGFADELQTELYKLYSDNRQEMRQTLSTMSMGLPYYHNLEWRFEVKLASRSLSHQMEPVVLLKLHTDDCGVRQTNVLETDPTNLVHLTQTLGAALEEVQPKDHKLNDYHKWLWMNHVELGVD